MAAGGSLLKHATRADWGGLSGYYADPDGHPWEVAYNPFFPLDDEGRVQITYVADKGDLAGGAALGATLGPWTMRRLAGPSGRA